MTDKQVRPSLHNPLQFLVTWRSFPIYELIGYIFMFAGSVMLAYGIHRYTMEEYRVIILSVATMYSGFFAALIWNDITDQDIDTVVHPTRPLPDRRITPKAFFGIALIFSVLTFLFALMLSLWCFILVGVAAVFTAVHNKYLKRLIKFPAYSEIFTPVQWLVVPLFGFFVVWSVLPHTYDYIVSVPLLGSLYIAKTDLLPMVLFVLFTYLADDAHDVAEGIHDMDGDRVSGVKTYSTSFNPGVAASVAFGMVVIAGILGILLYVYTLLSEVFLIPFLILWAYTLVFFYQLLRTKDPMQKQELGRLVGRKGYNFLLFSYLLIFVDLFLQLTLALTQGC